MQKIKCVFIVLVSLLLSLKSLAQSDLSLVVNEPVLLGLDQSIPEGYNFQFSSAFSPFGNNSNILMGSFSVSLSGVIEGSFQRESIIGNPFNQIIPSGQLTLRVQLIKQRDNLPSVSMFLNTMLNNQSEFFDDATIRSNISPKASIPGQLDIAYTAKSTIAGIGVKSELNEFLSINATLGVREVVWNQGWSKYSFDIGQPVTQDGWTAPIPEISLLKVNWSAGFLANPISNVYFLGNITSFPFVNLNRGSWLLEYQQGNKSTIGVMYNVLGSLFIELFDHHYSAVGSSDSFNQVTAGLSFGLKIQ